MNYRHAFHAGNFADVFKHAILTRILVHLRDKPAPFRVIDTHAGEGLYALDGEEAARTGEWHDGIGRLVGAPLAPAAAELLAPYLAVVRAYNPGSELRRYPGSPLIVRHLLRPQDRLIACELVAEAATALAAHLRAASRSEPAPGSKAGSAEHSASPRRRRDQAKALAMDGWVALEAFVPAKERRGLVLIDPPYECADDFARLAEGVVAAYRKQPTRIYLLWYPIKSSEGPDWLATAIRDRNRGNILRAELTVDSMSAGLGACGAIIINPPWKFAAELDTMLPALRDVMGRDAGRTASVAWLAPREDDFRA